MNAFPLARTLSAFPVLTGRGTRSLLLGAALLLGAPGTHAQAVSPAQAAFDRVNDLLVNEYGGLSGVDRAALRAEYQARLDAVCAPQPQDCPADKAYPVLQAEVSALEDQHSFFMMPQEFQDFIASVSGGNRRQFGVKLAALDGQNRVVLEVIAGSTAAQAGLQRGDVLLTLDGKPYTYTALRDARLSGQGIQLGFSRAGQTLTTSLASSESSTVDLPRLSYVSRNGKDVAVLRIPTFISGGGVAQTVHDLVGQAQARGVQGLVVDLRGNPGGSLIECDQSISAFVPTLTRLARTADGADATVVRGGVRLENGRVVGAPIRNPQLWTGPLTVLVDEGSGSCSEFFAYETQFAKRGLVVGEVTAGVGNTSTRVFQVGAAAVQLTLLHYVKPDGTPYPESVTPDVVKEQGEAEIRLLTQGVDSALEASVDALAGAPALAADLSRP